MDCAKKEARHASMLKLPFSLTQLGFKEHKGKKSGQMQVGLNLKYFMKWWWNEASAYLEEKPVRSFLLLVLLSSPSGCLGLFVCFLISNCFQCKVGEDEREDARQKLANHLEKVSYAMGSKKASSNTQGGQMHKLPDITGASNRFAT